jgi:hypothetical protein
MIATELALPLSYSVECRDASGRLKWREDVHNLTTTEGENSIINVYLRGSTQITSWFVGLKGAGAVSAADTHASHAAWTEFTGYSESTREALTLAAASAGASSNAASLAEFTINAAGTVAGAFVASVSTKGSTGAGVLLSVADFSSALTVASTDVLTVTISVT